MKLVRHTLVLLAAVVAAGCASTPDGLKADPSNRKEVSVSVPYQLAFKRITEAHRECAPMQLLPIGQVINDARLYPDLKMGTLTIGSSGMGTQIRQHLEVTASGDSSTSLVLYAGMRPQAFLDRYARWANGQPSCDV